MKKLFLNIIIFLIIWDVDAQQNLVTNGSFEEIDSCYADVSAIGFDVFDWSGCTGWSCPTMASSDLWCENFWGQSPPFIPGVGFQYPRTGQNYCGIFMYELVETNYREYVQNELTESLEENKYYQVTYYISPSDITYNSTNCIQVYFSDYEVYQPLTYYTLDVNPQVSNDNSNYILDTLGWQKIEGVYQATGGEKFMTLGCFEDSSTIIVADTNTITNSDIYFFCDDVSLVELPIEINFPNIFTPNEDGINDHFFPNIINLDDWELKIFNRWGNLIANLDSTSNSWDGSINNQMASEGVYYYIFNEPKYKIRKHGFFNLIR